MEQERQIQVSKAQNGWISSDRVRIFKPYSSEDFGHKQIGNYQNMQGGRKKINKYEVLNRLNVMSVIPILDINGNLQSNHYGTSRKCKLRSLKTFPQLKFLCGGSGKKE